MDPIRVLVAEDHPLTITGLRMVIGAQPNWVLVGETTNGGTLLAEIESRVPDVVLLDLGLPGRTGLDLLLDLQARPQRPRILILSGQNEPSAFQRALDAGADGVLTKSDRPEEIIAAVEAVMAGELFVSAALQPALTPSNRDHDESLTSRERDVLRCMSQGMSSKETGRELNISPATAKKHRENLMRKLDATTAVNAVREAQRLGLVGR